MVILKFIFFNDFFSYVGPLTVSVQELDGHFTHTIQVDAAISKHDIQCHSKGRKLKKKRVLLSSGEEVDMDLVQMEADSPILWLRYFCGIKYKK